MAFGDINFFVQNNLNYELPQSWFDPEGAVVTGVVAGMASGPAFNFAQLSDIANQARLATAEGAFLELWAQDYFGAGVFPRRPNETDASYRARISKEILRPRGTRAALVELITDLTGTAPTIFEPRNAQDCGGIGVNVSKPFAFGASGYLGSTSLPFQFFVTVTRPVGSGFPGISGLTDAQSGFGAGSWFALGDGTRLQSTVADDEIYAAIARTIPAGVTAWVSIQAA